MTRRVYHRRNFDQAGLPLDLRPKRFIHHYERFNFAAFEPHRFASPPPLPHRRYLPEQVKNEFLALRVLNKTDYSTMGLLDNALN